jgi:hypothetical protein
MEQGQSKSVLRELEVYTEEELALALYLEKRTLAAWRAEQRGPDYIKLGKNIFYRARDVREWIDANVYFVRRTD